MVAFGVSAASLTYAVTLAVQRFVPELKALLAITISEGVKPTYYLRVLVSLVVGLVAAAIGSRVVVGERALAWVTAMTIATSVLIVCAFP